MNKILILMITVLFIVVSIVPVSSLNVESMVSESYEPQIDTVEESSSFHNMSEDTHNPDLGEGLLDSYDGHYRELDERHPYHYRHHMRNYSDYLYEESFDGYPGYEEFKDAHRHRYENEYVKNYTIKDRKPTPKPNFSDGKTWYVDDDAEKPWLGTKRCPYRYIEDAVAASKDGDTVFVFSGTYSNVYIDKSIHIKGENRETTIIENSMVSVNADWVYINGFTFEEEGIYIYGYSHCTISNNYIFNTEHYGIYLSDSSNCTIINNIFSQSGIIIFGNSPHHWNNHIIENNIANGRFIRYYKNAEDIVVPNNTSQVILANCKYSTIQNLNLSDTDTGIQISFSTYVNITGNNVSNNYGGGIIIWDSSNNRVADNYVANNYEVGIYLNNHSNCNNISGNIISNNGDYYGGIYIQSSSENTISENTLTNNEYHGIWLDQSADGNIISGNNISDNDYGINLEYSNNNIITCNSISKNRYGINLKYTNNNIIMDNSFHKSGLSIDSDSYQNIVENNIVNDKPLIYLTETSDKNIVNAGQVILIGCSDISIINQDLSNTTVGIQLFDTENCVISDNIIADNYGGISLEESSYNRISGNNVKNNYYYGITLEHDSDYNVIKENNIMNILWDGIELYRCSSNDISNNIIKENERGIQLCSSGKNVISGNKIMENDRYGIDIQRYSSRNLITHNTISNNRWDGIYLEGSSEIAITNNSFISNGITLSGWWDLEERITHTIKDNHVDGRTIYFYKNNHDGIIVPPDAGQVIMVNCSNFVMQNLVINDVAYGIQLLCSLNNTISSCIIKNNNEDGIFLRFCSNNIISENTIENCGWSGIELQHCDNNIITGNNIMNSGGGIDIIFDCYKNAILYNNITNNNWHGVYLDSPYNQVAENNIANNNYYGLLLGWGSGYSCVKGNNITENNEAGIQLRHSSNITILDNNISNNGDGILIDYASACNKISNNYCDSNFRNGIVLKGSNNLISNCTIQHHMLSGIYLGFESSNNDIKDCFISQNWRGIEFDHKSKFNKVINCLISGNYWGIKLSYTMFNSIEKCTISDNACGIMRGELNFIRKNNFIDNEIFHAFGELQHKNFWFRNYYNGHNTPLPCYLYGFNFDWFPKATPYDYPQCYDEVECNPDNTLKDWSNLGFQGRDLEEINTCYNLKDRILERLSSLCLNVRWPDVLNHRIQRLRSWLDDNEDGLLHHLDTRGYLMNLRGEMH